MKRIILSIAAVAALSLGGLFTDTAQAHGPYVCRTPPYRYNNARVYSGYSSGYSPYRVYGNYATPIMPYGAGYAGGFQPYSGPYYQQPRFGLYLGF